MNIKKLFIAIGVWLLIIGFMVLPNQIQLMRDTDTILLETRPVDPRDLLRGDYVILRYEISDLNSIPGGSEIRLDAGKSGPQPTIDVYVSLEVGEDNIARATRASTTEPQTGRYIKGTIGGDRTGNSWWWARNSRDIDFGIEKYFVPEGKGRTIERSRNMDVEISLSDKGKALIKQLWIDDKPVDFENVQARSRNDWWW